MKMTKLFSASVAAVALLAACNKQNVEPVQPEAQGTHARISFQEVLRADADQVDEAGLGVESKVSKATLISADNSTVSFSRFEDANGVWTSEAALYNGTIGTQQRALVVNYAGISSITDPALTVGIADLSTLAKAGSFAMSSISTGTHEILADIAADAVRAGNNLLPFEVERLVSKVQVSKNATVANNVPTRTGSFTDFRFAVAGSAKEMYAFLNNAGSRTMVNGQYANLKTWASEKKATLSVVDATTKAITTRRDGVTKVSDPDNENVWSADGTFAAKKSLEVKEFANYASKSNEQGIFFFENSLPTSVYGADKTITAGAVHFEDMTAVKVYAKYVPGENEVIGLVGEELKPVAATEYPTGFYLGMSDNKLYASVVAAQKAVTGQKTKFYADGIMFWWVPANAQKTTDNKAFIGVDTRRNNIYSINIEAIAKFGNNFDKNDPTDPNIPKDKVDEGNKPTPNEPDPTDDSQLDPKETNIKVSAKVLPWNLVHQKVTLQ